jgi:hypothetical protein
VRNQSRLRLTLHLAVEKTAASRPNSGVVAISENEISGQRQGRDQVSRPLRRDSGSESAIAIATSLHR